MRQEYPIKRAQDRIGHQSGLMSEEHDEKRGLRESETQVPEERAHMAAPCHAGVARHDRSKHREQGGYGDGQDNECGPNGGRAQWQRPSDEQCGDGNGRRERAAQVV